jgi:hypothetical protein
MIPSSRPGVRLSVVIAASNGPSSLEQCLRSLKGDGQLSDTEIIAVTNFDATQMLHGRFPYVQHASMPADTTVPALRTVGIWRSSGEIVALAEDHCTFGDGWCFEIKKAHELPYSVIGGSIENASHDRALDWAMYFYDYSKFMLPNQAGVVGYLPGNDVSFKRSVLKQVETSLRDGFFEAFMNVELKTRGHALYLMPSVVVYHQKNYELRKAITQCCHLGRGFAGKRVLNAPIVKRGALLLGSFALPALLPGRIVVRTVRKGRHLKELVRALPYLLLLTASWSWGEFSGYLVGEGSSAGKWR